jgi:serine/threonine-protein kinase
VTLFVSSGPAITHVEVPDVTGSSRAEAYSVLEDTGLRPEGLSEPSDAVAAGIVVRTDPIAGTLVEEGAPVTVVVSSGPSVIVVPEVVGRMSDDAVARLQAVGLNATTSFVPDYATYGEVVESRPPAGTEMEPGDTVELLVSCAASVCD